MKTKIILIILTCSLIAGIDLKADSGPESIRRPIYYQIQDVETEEVKVYKCVLNPENRDILLFSKKEPFRLLCRSRENGKFIACENNRLYEVNMEEKTTKELLRLKSNRRITSFSFSHDRKRFALSAAVPVPESDLRDGELWIGDTGSYKAKLFYKKAPLDQYMGLSVAGWTAGDKHVVFKELGMEGGDTWGTLFKVAVSNPAGPLPVYHKENGSSYLLGELSPDGRLWLFTFCSEKKDVGGSSIHECEEGSELRIYDLQTKKERTLYKNLEGENNASRAQLRAIYSYKWLDSDHVVITTPHGLMRFNVASGKSTMILEWYHPFVISNIEPTILLAGWDKTVLTFEGFNDAFVFFSNTGKLLQLKKNIPVPEWATYRFFR